MSSNIDISNLIGNINIENSYSTGNANGAFQYGGGFIGYFLGSSGGTSTIKNSYSTGDITARTYSGGFIGYAYYVKIENVCSAGNTNITGSTSTGAFIGYLNGSSIKNSYYNSGSSLGNSSKAVGKSADWFTEENIKSIVGNTTISQTNNSFQDIVIKNAEISATGGTAGVLFGAGVADVSNVSISGTSITGATVGGVAGNIADSNISNVTVNILVNSTQAGGGIAGSATATNIEYANSKGTTKGTNSAGLVGLGNSVNISNSYTTGSNVVGLVHTLNNGSILNSYSTAATSSFVENLNNSSISNSFATATATNFVGSSTGASNILNSYAINTNNFVGNSDGNLTLQNYAFEGSGTGIAVGNATGSIAEAGKAESWFKDVNNVKEIVAVGESADIWNFTVEEIVNKNIQATAGMTAIEEEEAEELGYTVVKTQAELATAIANNDAKIMLFANIDMSGWTTASSYTGEIDGNGYSLTGLSTSFIESVENATIQNLNISADISEDNAAIIQNSTNSTYKNITITGSITGTNGSVSGLLQIQQQTT